MPRSGPGPTTRLAPTRTSPEVGLRKPAMMFSSVVLPQPDGPRIVTISPVASFSETSSSACTAAPSAAA